MNIKRIGLIALIGASLASSFVTSDVFARTHYYGGVGYKGAGYYRGMEYAHGYYSGTAIVFGAYSRHIEPSKNYGVAKTMTDPNVIAEQVKKVEATPYYYVARGNDGNDIINRNGQIVDGPEKNLHVGRLDKDGHIEYTLYEKGGNTIIEHKPTNHQITVPKKDITIDDTGIIYSTAGDKVTYFNLEGHQLNQKPFKDVQGLYGDLKSVSTNGKHYGIFNVRTGEALTAQIYNSIRWNQYTGLMTATGKGDRTDYYDVNGKVVDRNLARAIITDKAPESTKATPMPPMVAGQGILRTLAPFSEGIAFVKLTNGDKVAIDESGKILFSIKDYDTVDPYEDGLALVTRKAHGFNWGGILSTAIAATVRGAFWHQVRYGETDYAWTTSQVKRGYIDKTGKEVISSKNQRVSPLTEAGIMTYKDGKFGLYSKSGEEIFPMVYKNITYMPESDAFILQNEEGKWGVVGQDKKVLVPFSYDGLEASIPTVLVSKVGKEYGLISLVDYKPMSHYYDKIMVPKAVGDVYSALVAKQNDMMYLINPVTSDVILSLPAGTTDVYSTTLNTATYKANGKVGVIGFDGKVIVAPNYKSIQIFAPVKD